MIGELVILFRVEHLEQRGGGVAPRIRAHLINLVQQHDRVLHAHAFHAVDESSGHGRDVRAPVSAHVRLVSHSAQRDALKRPRQRLGDGPRQRRLPDAGRAEETQDGRSRLGSKATHREVLHDAIFHLVQAVMLRVEDRARLRYGNLARLRRRLFAPRERRHRLHPRARRAVRGRLFRHLTKLSKLRLGRLERLRRRVRGVQAPVESVEVVCLIGGAVRLAELLANRLHLLPKDVLALGLTQAALHAFGHVSVDHERPELGLDERQRALHAFLRARRVEESEASVEVVLERGDEEVGESVRWGARKQRLETTRVALATLELIHELAGVGFERGRHRGELGIARLVV